MAEIYRAKTAEQLIDAQKRFLLSKNSTLNNYNPGSRLMTLIEAVSLTSSETQNDFYQALLKAIPIAIYSGFNFKKLAGTKAIGELQFSRSTVDISDHPIAIGTQIIINGIKYETIEAGSILIGALTSGAIGAQCTTIGESSNISANAINTLIGQGSFINQPEGIESCLNPTAFTGGTDEESDADRLQRFVLYINSLARSTTKGLLYAARSVGGVKSAIVVEYYPADGWVTIYADDGTGALSASMQAEILKVINGDLTDEENYPGYKAGGIHIQVLPPDVTLVNITAVLYAPTTSELSDTELINLATTAIQKYTNSLRIGDDWIHSQATTSVENVSVDILDFIISSPAGNVVIASNRLARTGTISITVTRI